MSATPKFEMTDNPPSVIPPKRLIALDALLLGSAATISATGHTGPGQVALVIWGLFNAICVTVMLADRRAAERHRAFAAEMQVIVDKLNTERA